MTSKSEEKFAKAEGENRLITEKEGEIRKKVGYILLGATLIACAIFPSLRTAYGPLSLVCVSAIGTWRTGKESL
jgi:hypothetical protein